MILLGDNSAYEKLHQDPVKKQQREMNKQLLDLKKQECLRENVYRILHCNNGLTPRFYGLPKNHKQGIQLTYWSILRLPNLSTIQASVSNPTTITI